MPAFDIGRTQLADGTTNWVSADIRMMIMAAAFSFDPADSFVADIVLNEQGTFARQALGTRTFTDNTAAAPNRTEYRTADSEVTFPSVAAGAAPAFAVLFRQVTNDADSVLIAAIPLSSPDAPNGNNYDINQPTEGWIYLDAVGTT